MLEIVQSAPTPAPPATPPVTAGRRQAERLIADKLANARREVIKAGTVHTNAAQAVERGRAGVYAAPDDADAFNQFREAKIALEHAEIAHEAKAAAVERLEAAITEARANGSIDALGNALEDCNDSAATARQAAREKRAAEIGAELTRLIEEADRDTTAISAARSKASHLAEKIGLSVSTTTPDADRFRYPIRRAFHAAIEASKLPSFLKGWFVGR